MHQISRTICLTTKIGFKIYIRIFVTDDNLFVTIFTQIHGKIFMIRNCQRDFRQAHSRFQPSPLTSYQTKEIHENK